MEFFNIINSQKLGSGEYTSTVDPRSGETLWQVPVAAEVELNNAVEAAREAFKSWKQVPIDQRQNYVESLAQQLEANRDEIRDILAKETGKSILLANLEIDDTLKFIRFYAMQSVPDSIDYEDEKLRIVSSHPPLGLVGAICPWNFPLVLAAAKISAALVTGNCIIVKPSPYTPYATLKFAELAIPVLPAGVFQALNGNNDVGKLMTLHPAIDKISFTGSTATGRKVAESTARTFKRLTLELGGNDASIVCPDVDVAHVARQVAAGSFFHAGQMCVATKRVYVHRDIFEEFTSAFVDAVKETEINASNQQPSLFTPLQNKMQYDIVKDFIRDTKAQGYHIACGGETDQSVGFFIKPTVVVRPADNSKVVQEEQFGPIIPLLEWSIEDDVVARANDTDSGLGACVWARDPSIAERIAHRLDVGTVWINSFAIPNPYGYLSGWKQSGLGGEWGRQGLLSYCHTRVLQIYK